MGRYKNEFALFRPRERSISSVIILMFDVIIAGSLESANSSILAARRHFKEVVGKKIRILL